MKKKNVILLVKVVIFVAVVAFVGRFVWNAWVAWQQANVAAAKAHLLATIDWRYGVLAVLGFIGVMLVSGLTWRWLAWRMGDRSPTVRAVGAYTFSQMFKYVPGKVALLLARIDRAGRFGMTAEICTLSTLLENALYMVSGALVGMFAVTHIAAALPADLPHRELFRAAMWPATIAAVVVLAIACHPRVFYTLVDALLKKMGKAPVPREERLGMGTLALGVLMFVPCWACGAVALWASTCCLHPVPIGECGWFIGAFSLSVIIGMLSFLPGGAVIREVVLGTAVTLQLQANGVRPAQAVLLGTMVAVLQRVFQLVAELIVLIGGAVLTRKRAAGEPGGGTKSAVTPDGAAVEE